MAQRRSADPDEARRIANIAKLPVLLGVED